MKRISILLIALTCQFALLAQKSNITSALNYLKDSDFENAKKSIDEAVANESTKANAKAWLVKAIIYQAIGSPIPKDLNIINIRINDNDYPLNINAATKLQASTPNAINTAVEAFKKTMALDTKYNKDEIQPLVKNLLFQSFNEGIGGFNKNDFKTSYDKFAAVNELATMDNGKLFAGDATMDTIKSQALLYSAYSADNLNNVDIALPLLEQCMKDPIAKNHNVYLMAAEIYKTKGQNDKFLSTIQAGKALYPTEQAFKNEELNYLIQADKTEELIAKFNEAIAADPKNAENYFGLGNAYEKIASGKKGADGKGVKPANAEELLGKALEAYNKAIAADGNNPDYYMNVGVIFFNKAKDINDGMNKEKDDKKYDALRVTRDDYFNKAIPSLERAVMLMEAKTIDDNNKASYKQVLGGLKNAYAVLNKADKIAEIDKKLKGL